LTGAVVNKAKCKYFYQLALAVKHSLIRSIFVLIILLFITIPGCKKDVIQDNHLTGQWQWEYSEGGYSFHKITPANNSLRLLNFYPNSTFSVTESGNASFNGTFTVTGDTTSGKIIHFISDYFGDPNGEVYTIRNNQLILTDYMIADGFRHYYKRVK
jgi:hypothetical protein